MCWHTLVYIHTNSIQMKAINAYYLAGQPWYDPLSCCNIIQLIVQRCSICTVWLLTYTVNNHHWQHTVQLSLFCYNVQSRGCSDPHRMPSNPSSIYVWGVFTHTAAPISLCQKAVGRLLKPWRAARAWHCLPKPHLQPLPMTNRYWSVSTPATVPLTRVSRVALWDWTKVTLPGTLLDTVPLLGFITLLHSRTGFLWECFLINHLYENLYLSICF